TWRERLRSRAGWADAAGYTVSDLTMLRRELLIGYLVAGFIAVAVPAEVFTTVFLSGHGLLTDVENVVLGPLIAFVSFVCSVGNVPLAAALYDNGISFGGTVAFVFADLLALPLVAIYAKFYGRPLATRMFFVFWAVMSTAGLLTDLLFRGGGIAFPHRKHEIAMTHFSWNYTTFLNLAFLVVAAVVYWLYRQRDTAGGAYAKDPVCGMQVERAHPGAIRQHEGHTVYFCADRCAERFEKDPGRFDAPVGEPTGALDPVCGMTVDPATAAARTTYAGTEQVFCATGCRDRFVADPLSFLTEARDPVCGMTVEVAHPGARATVDGTEYVFCCQGCADRLAADPAAHLGTAELSRT
ncbi:MAG: YHS domain-containing protein, partial [Mycobacteriales bacterium]